MPRFFIAGIVLFLLFGAGYAITQAARSIPWDCSDWQAFAHADCNTAILESLAENRGQTLYCGLDQSDTFTKAETWQAGKDRNERDDTVYWGERGSFRGFIAAQEGWLTEGESGITGQSEATIFEFPRPERRGRRTKLKLIPISGSIGSCGTNPFGSPLAPTSPRGDSCPNGYHTGNIIADARRNYNRDIHPHIRWPELAKAQARILCRNRYGYPIARITSIPEQSIPHSHTAYAPIRWEGLVDGSTRVEWQVRSWTGNCVKKVKGSRRD